MGLSAFQKHSGGRLFDYSGLMRCIDMTGKFRPKADIGAFVHESLTCPLLVRSMTITSIASTPTNSSAMLCQ